MSVTFVRRQRSDAWACYRLASRLCAREGVSEAVTTRAHLNVNPEIAWDHVMLYEEVPGQPPLLLRALLPCPVRTEGDKLCVGAIVRCIYKQGNLVKRITRVTPPSSLEFEILAQRLGIEGCALTLGGSYEIQACDKASDVLLNTNYRAYLRPRFLWRRLEAFLVRRLHNHILDGIRREVLLTETRSRAAVAEASKPKRLCQGGIAWISQLSSRH
jgi:hypothetical protein